MGFFSEGLAMIKEMKAKVNVLNSGKIKNPEFILYFKKEGDAWFMELESSLR